MADTMTVLVKVFEPDGTTSRETYTEALGTKTDNDMVIRDLEFTVMAKGGCAEFSFTIFKEVSTISTVIGDIIEIWSDEGAGSTLRFRGKITNVNPNYGHLTPVYEDRARIVGYGLLMLADHINYSLIDTNTGTVSTNIQTVYTDLFNGGQYSGKNQDLNIPITSASSLITYSAGNNTLPSFSINASWSSSPVGAVLRDIINIANGTIDLTSVEPYTYRLKLDDSFHTEQRVTTVLHTFNITDGDFPVGTSDEVADYSVETDTDSIRNFFSLNKTELTSLQYGTEVTASRTTYATKQATPMDNPAISITEGQNWLDGFVLDMLEPISKYTLRLDKKTYGFSPVWFLGSSDTTNGYIKLLKGAGTEFNEPFMSARYSLDSGGWDITIEAGAERPNIGTRSRMLTELSGINSTTMQGSPIVFDPSSTVDENSASVIQLKEDTRFEFYHYDPANPLTAADVKFKIYTGGDVFWGGGSVGKTITSASTPAVYEDSTRPGVFVCDTYATTTATSKVVNSNTVHGINISNVTNAIYGITCEITKVVNGVTHVLESAKTLFHYRDKSRDEKVVDLDTRMPEAEKKSVVNYDPGSGAIDAEVKFFDDVVDTPPDSGSEGWFVTPDNDTPSAWIRVGADPTGTPNDSFEINLDDSSEGQVYLVFNVNSGSDKGAFEYDYNSGSPRLRYAVDFDEVTPSNSTWTNVGTGVSNAILDTFTALDYELKVNSSDGSLTFTKDPTGTPAVLFKIANDGTITTYDAILPAVDDQDDIGSTTKRYANIHCSNEVRSTDFVGTYAGVTDDYSITWDNTEGKAYMTNIAQGWEAD
jgi:hypothetical protein